MSCPRCGGHEAVDMSETHKEIELSELSWVKAPRTSSSRRWAESACRRS
jgi:hypothetical protein